MLPAAPKVQTQGSTNLSAAPDSAARRFNLRADREAFRLQPDTQAPVRDPNPAPRDSTPAADNRDLSRDRMPQAQTSAQSPAPYPAVRPANDRAQTDTKTDTKTDTRTDTQAPADPAVRMAIEPDQAMNSGQDVKALIEALQAQINAMSQSAGAADAGATGLTDALKTLIGKLKSLLAASDKTENQGAVSQAVTQTDTLPSLLAQMNSLIGQLTGQGQTPDQIVKALAADPEAAQALSQLRQVVGSVNLGSAHPERTIAAKALSTQALSTQALSTQDKDSPVPAPNPDVNSRDSLNGAVPRTFDPSAKPVEERSTVQRTDASGAVQTAKAGIEAALNALKPDATTLRTPDSAQPPAGYSPQAQTQAPAVHLAATSEAATGAVPLTSVQTMADLSAQIQKRLSQSSTHFDIQLHPADMGKVEVRLSISHDGNLTAALNFDSPVAASQLKSQADELRRDLEQQGFKIADSALSFSSGQGERNPQNQNQGQNQGTGSQSNMAGFQDALDSGDGLSVSSAAYRQMKSDMTGSGAHMREEFPLLGGRNYRLSLNLVA